MTKSPDANDILREHGAPALRAAFDTAPDISDIPLAPRPRKNGQGLKISGADHRFYLTPFDSLAMTTDRAYLVKGLIPAKGLTVVWGPPKCGKSFWTFDVALHVARGLSYRGRRVKGGPVVYCAFEGASGYRARAEAYRREFLAIDPVLLYLMAARIDLSADHRALIEDIAAQLDGAQPALVVLDTLNRSLSGSESKDEDMAAYVWAADAIREHFSCAVIIVHHCGVNDKRPRGHTSLTGAADAQLAVSRDAAGLIRVSVEFMKDGPEGDEIVSRLKVVDLGADEDGDAITSCVIEPVDAAEAGPAARKHDAAPKLTAAEKIVFAALRAVHADHAKALEGGIYSPPPSVVPIKLWRERALMKLGRDNADSGKKAFQRAKDGLLAKNAINIWDEFVWPTEK